MFNEICINEEMLPIYIYIYIFHPQTVLFYQNSSVWLGTQDARSWDRNPSKFTLDCVSDHYVCVCVCMLAHIFMCVFPYIYVCIYVHVSMYVQCNPDIRELSGPENKSLISVLHCIFVSIHNGCR